MGSALQRVQGRGALFSPSRCSWGASFLPPRLWGLGSGVFASPGYPDVASPCVPQATGEGVSNLSFRSCTWGVSSPPSLMFWERESHFPFTQSLEFSGAKPLTFSTHVLWKLFGGSGTNRPLNLFGAWPWSLSNPMKPSSPRVSLNLGVFAFFLASPTPPQGAHSVNQFVDAFQVKS